MDLLTDQFESVKVRSEKKTSKMQEMPEPCSTSTKHSPFLEDSSASVATSHTAHTPDEDGVAKPPKGKPEPELRHQRCLVCSSSAKDCCAGCSDIIYMSDTTSTRAFYCSKECQAIDWPKHKLRCKANKQTLNRSALHKAAEFLQLVYYAFREEAFDLSIEELYWDENTLILHEGKYDVGEVLVDFPHHLIKKTEKDTLSTVLALTACTDTMMHLHSIFVQVLENSKIAKKIEEVHFDLKPGPRDFIFFRQGGIIGDADSCLHCAHKVTLNDGSNWAIDLAGAQFGYTKPCQLWEDYHKERIKRVRDVSSFGAVLAHSEHLRSPKFSVGISDDDPRGRCEIIHWAGHQVARAMTDGINSGFEEERLNARRLLFGLGRADYEKASQAIIDSGVRHMKWYKEQVAKAGGFVSVQEIKPATEEQDTEED